MITCPYCDRKTDVSETCVACHREFCLECLFSNWVCVICTRDNPEMHTPNSVHLARVSEAGAPVQMHGRLKSRLVVEKDHGN
jgi:hypothetical protein